MNDEVKHKRRMNIIDAEFKISCLPECSSPSPKENLKSNHTQSIISPCNEKKSPMEKIPR